MASLKKNIAYQTAYEVLNVCLPLITAPYLSRVLGATQLGIYSYTSSIVNYFALFAMLGVANYGARTIAAYRNNQHLAEEIYSEVYSIQLITTVTTIFAYAILLYFSKENKLILAIQGIELLSRLFQVNWLYTAYEKIQDTVKVQTIIRLITVVLILVLVKSVDDLWIYVLLMSVSTAATSLVLWLFSGKIASYRRPKLHNLKKHIRPIMVLFIPLLAMSFYHLMDKAMLGWLSSYEQSGFYHNADKVINIPIGMITAVGVVLLPRISVLVSDGRNDLASNMFIKSIKAIMISSCAVAFGIAAISKEFTPIFFGSGYEECILLIMLLSPVLIVKAISTTMRNAYLMPHHKDKCYIYSVIFGAIINLMANWILIPDYGAKGAVLGTLLAECAACFFQLVYVRKEMPLFKEMARDLAFVLIGCIMFVSVRLVASITENVSILKLFLEIFVGAIVYVLLSFLYLRWTDRDSLEVYLSILKSKTTKR